MTRIINLDGATIGVVCKVSRKVYAAYPNGDVEAHLPSVKLAREYVERNAQYSDFLR